MLRVVLPDRPGALAAVAGAIATVGGDIQAVDVVESQRGVALDDLVVFVDPARGRALVDAVRAVPGVKVVHAAPSRGHPGDAVTRLAMGVEALLNGAMTPDHGVEALVGGLLRADSVQLLSAESAPVEEPGVLVLECDERALVVRRAYRFTDTERERASAVLRACLSAGTAAQAQA